LPTTAQPNRANGRSSQTSTFVHSASLGDVESATAGSAAATPVVIVSPGDTLDHAARLMVESKATHLIVVDPGSVRPMGVLSTLDVAERWAS
jgi:CBS domain-containing protein